MTVYKVFYKDCYRKKIVLLGTLIERRRKGLRGMSPLEAGLKRAKGVFGDKVKDIKRSIVVPKEVKEESDNARLSLD